MANYITGKKKIRTMMILFFLIYFTSYITRSNFNAVLEGIRKATDYTKDSLKFVATISIITYGVGQLISGFMGDKIQPKILLLAGLSVSCVMNVLIPFMPSTGAMCVLWGINGFAQSFMWPPLVKLMAGLFEKQQYDKAVIVVSWGAMLGTSANYLIAFLFVSVLNWKFVFFTSAFIGVVVAILIITICPKIELSVKEKLEKLKSIDTEVVKTNKIKWFSFTVVIVMICIVLQGSLRDGIATWMPTFINDEFNLGDNIAILSGVLMPLLGIVSFTIASKLYAKKFTNPMTCAGVIFVPAAICAIVLVFPVIFNLEIGVIPTIIAIAILNGCMHGTNVMLVCMVPKYFSFTGKVSLISGLLNAFTYVGSAISIFVYPMLGLGAVKIVWMVTAVLGMVLSFVIAKSFRKKYMER